jgi:hypothetical protein
MLLAGTGTTLVSLLAEMLESFPVAVMRQREGWIPQEEKCKMIGI